MINPSIESSLKDAIRSIEAASSAEVVVDVRSRSGSYAHADGRAGALLAFVALLVVLFSPVVFDPFIVPGVVLTAYAAGMLLSMQVKAVRRLFTSRRERDANVRTHAAAAFFEQGIGRTANETGILLYLSLVEQRLELIADRGVLDAVPVLEWNQIVDAAHTRGANLQTLDGVLRALLPLLTRYLPVRASDRDELSSEIRVSGR